MSWCWRGRGRPGRSSRAARSGSTLRTRPRMRPWRGRGSGTHRLLPSPRCYASRCPAGQGKEPRRTPCFLPILAAWRRRHEGQGAAGGAQRVRRRARPLVPREGTFRRQQERDVVGGEELGSLGEREALRRDVASVDRLDEALARGVAARSTRPRIETPQISVPGRESCTTSVALDSSLRFATFRLRDEVASAIESPVTANHIGTAWITPSGSLVQKTPTSGAPSNSATSGSASTSAERRSRLGFGCEPSCTAAS